MTLNVLNSTKVQALQKNTATPSFRGIKEFTDAISKKDMEPALFSSPDIVAENLALLFKNLNSKDAFKIYTAMDKGPGLKNLLNLAGKEVPVDQRGNFVNELATTVSEIDKKLERGLVERNVPIKYNGNMVTDGIRLTKYGAGPGENPVEFPASLRDGKVFTTQEISFKDFVKKAFGESPRLILCPVGWTIPNPDLLAQNNSKVNDKFESARMQLIQGLGTDKGEVFENALKKVKKQIAAEYYQIAFKKFWEPVAKVLFDDLKMSKDKIGFLTSASYDGIDKAAMDFAKAEGIKVANITPWEYACWANPEGKEPLLITNTIEEYADGCSLMSDILMVLGGRDHSLEKDAERALIKNKKPMMAVDILNENYGLDVPALVSGKLENATRYLQEAGFDLAANSYAKNLIAGSSLTDTQKQVATIIYKLYGQVSDVDENQLVDKLVKKIKK